MGEIKVRDDILRKIQEAKENQLEELDLSNDHNTPDEYKLSKIPEEVFRIKTLKRLALRYNKLYQLPESLGDFTSLNELDMRGNQLKSLPESFCNLTSLKTMPYP
ncbi:MAG: hypothetical protein AAGA80_17650 [Cyanobacteria bacterium P01_F01_bin.143]